MSDEVILTVSHITKRYTPARGREPGLPACNDICLSVCSGQTLGIVGESGCGKSTLARMIARILQPDSGEILFKDRDLTKLKGEELRQSRRNLQMIFQDPAASFSPRMKVMDIVTEPLLNFHLIRRSERREKAKGLFELVGLSEEFLGRYPHSMSGGQRQRVAIARALSLEPELLVCDEATSALDVSVQESVVRLLADLQRKKGVSMIFICHDIALVQSLAHQVAVMYRGEIVEVLPGEKVGLQAAHPYTQALLESVFSIHMDFGKKLEGIGEDARGLQERSDGCPFQNRCGRCTERCRKEKPVLREVEENHLAACHLLT